MTTADWALVVSLCSMAISLAAFIWNIWSKFIYPKPRVQVSVAFMTWVGSDPKENVCSLSATNHGPIAVTLYCALEVKWEWLKRNEYSLLVPLHDYPMRRDHGIGPFGGGLPKKIEVGEQFSVYFPPDAEALADDEFDQIGFTDTFGRHHWAPKKQLMEVQRRVRAYIAERGQGQAPPPDARPRTAGTSR
jgi:hypothetical protein